MSDSSSAGDTGGVKSNGGVGDGKQRGRRAAGGKAKTASSSSSSSNGNVTVTATSSSSGDLARGAAQLGMRVFAMAGGALFDIMSRADTPRSSQQSFIDVIMISSSGKRSSVPAAADPNASQRSNSPGVAIPSAGATKAADHVIAAAPSSSTTIAAAGGPNVAPSALRPADYTFIGEGLAGLATSTLASTARRAGASAAASPAASTAVVTASPTDELLLAQQLQHLLRGLASVNEELEQLGPELRAASWQVPRGTDLGRRVADLAARAADLSAAARRALCTLGTPQRERQPSGRRRGAAAAVGKQEGRREGQLVVEAVEEYLAAVERHLRIAIAPPSAGTASGELAQRLRKRYGISNAPDCGSGTGSTSSESSSSSSSGAEGGASGKRRRSGTGRVSSSADGDCDFHSATHAVYEGAVCRIHWDEDEMGGGPVVLAPSRVEIAKVPPGKRRLVRLGDPEDTMGCVPGGE